MTKILFIAQISPHGGKGGRGRRGGVRGSYRKGSRGGTGYQGKSNNFKGSKANMECYYCHKPGYLISECRKKMYNDKNRNNSSDSPSPADTSTNWRIDSNFHITNSNTIPTKLLSMLVSRIMVGTANLGQLHFSGEQTLRCTQQRPPILNQILSPGSSTLPPTPTLLHISNVSTNIYLSNILKLSKESAE
jgi:hypothetical protein